jgi:hypothetical protein
MKRALPWLLVAAALAAAALLRYGLIEPEGYGFRCEAGGPWWCGPRDIIIAAFHTRLIGWLALVAGAAAFLTRHRGTAAAAGILGAFGLVLYNPDLSAVGFALGTLVLARTAPTHAASTGTA